MSLTGNHNDNRVGRYLFGKYQDGDYEEPMILEYRYLYNKGFDISTHIKNKEYRPFGTKFFDAMADLLDQVPLTASVTFWHSLFVAHKGIKKRVDLEEWLFPYDIRGTGTVLYKLRLPFDETYIETQRHTSFGKAAEELRGQLGDDRHLLACYYCQYLVEYNEYGGTDYRHDQLYCFRDSRETLAELMKSYPKLYGKEQLLSHGTPDMDALHTCSTFAYRSSPRP